jgi:3-oxoacyl-[acyl-carrier protein] reductase
MTSPTSADRHVALVTGSTSGIGESIALGLASIGYDLIVNGTRSEEEARSVIEGVESAGARVAYVQADISVPEDRVKLVERARGLRRLDLLVNNAGIPPNERADLLDVDEASFDRVMDVNLKGTFFLTQEIARFMIELTKTLGQYSPKIINIGSISSYTSSPVRGQYCISKAGVSMVTKLFADRLSEWGINVYEIRPGIIRTRMTEPVRPKYDRLIAEGVTPIGRWGTPEDVAKAVVAIAKGSLPFSTGEVINVDGGFHLRRL